MKVISKKEDAKGFRVLTEDEKFGFEVFAMSELTYISARHITEAETDKKTGKEVICYYDRKDGKKDEYVAYLPYEYTDTHSAADVRDTIRNVRRLIVATSIKLEQFKILKRYHVSVEFEDGRATDCRVTAYNREQALSRLFRNEKFCEFMGSEKIKKVEIENEESNSAEGCQLYMAHGKTYIRHLTFPRVTCEVTFDTDSDLKVMAIDPRDEPKATALDMATAMREMGDYLIRHGKRSNEKTQ